MISQYVIDQLPRIKNFVSYDFNGYEINYDDKTIKPLSFKNHMLSKNSLNKLDKAKNNLLKRLVNGEKINLYDIFKKIVYFANSAEPSFDCLYVDDRVIDICSKVYMNDLIKEIEDFLLTNDKRKY